VEVLDEVVVVLDHLALHGAADEDRVAGEVVATPVEVVAGDLEEELFEERGVL
jgi:hypothetical protein